MKLRSYDGAPMKLSERLVFSPSVEGLVRGLGAALTENATLKAELRAMGLDLDKPLLPGYPAELWHRALELIARKLYPQLTVPQAYFKMGERTVYGLSDTIFGKATIALAKLVGPRKMLHRMPISVKSGSNFAELSVQELSPTEILLASQPYMGWGEYMQGSVLAAITLGGAVEPSVEIVEYNRSSEKLVLRSKWRT